MQSRLIAAIGIASTLALGTGLPAHAQGQNPEGINLQHYECYRVTTGQTRPIPVRLKDQFGSSEARVLTPVFLCNPVQKNEEPIKDEKTHLVCYQITGPRQANKTVRVKNQFGEQQLRATVAQLLCVPSLKEVVK
jgi:hypothetical protein